MLRISVVNTPGTTRLKLEGKLAHEWVQEAASVWSTLVGMNNNLAIVVDLLSVSFVDDAGHQLLADMRHAGAELVGCGPMITALIEEIEQSEARENGSDWEIESENNGKEINQ
jgi:anti-anti-sigma regulatory factor